MHNAMLDRLPEDYNGWLIRTDYRIGVQIQLCISDPELDESERTWTALSLLYGNGIPPQSGEADNEPPLYCFERDSSRIVSGFRKVFGIDISRERLHWFEFVSMLGDLKDTAFSGVMEIRSTDPSEVDKRKRAEFIRMKNRFALSSQYTAEEQAKIEEFDRLLGTN